MGVSCVISLKAPPGGVFLAGSVVTGEITYSVNENTVIKRITMSLKGIGTVRVVMSSYKRQHTTFNKERYVDNNEIILDKGDQHGTTLNAGSYNAPFKFVIPEKVPPSTRASRREGNYRLKYKIAYFVSMKFERPGFMAFPKRFRKEIQVKSDITPTLPREPLTYGEQKKLFHPFSSTDSIVHIKSTILDSVVKAGDILHFEYEVSNKSHLAILAMQTKIVEMITPKKRRKHITFKHDMPGTDAKQRRIEVGETPQLFVDIKIPADALTIDTCELATRKYGICITAILPLPHLNLQLLIPIEVLMKRDTVIRENDAPPSYWDVMREEKNKLESLFE
ncbi:uncharacterized protein LOC119836530 [Zerene cesonia]|uniref:uncharacterized protein LOC119836530 n=1 Tax=Zerene cesonia TaxID=33412 RepID=UPI0018E57B34|nr:uncharacterized protein LOC119836530 [Zerene cesonia]